MNRTSNHHTPNQHGPNQHRPDHHGPDQHLGRRGFLFASAALPVGLALPAATTAAYPSSGVAVRKERPELNDAVAAGVAYFRRRCDDQLPLVESLLEAIRSRDLSAARRAYVESRPPYEEIETCAYAFEDSDRDIDARPYAFDGGETDEAFRGFHKIEAMLYAYDDLESAEPFAETLVASIKRLRAEMDQLDRFDAAGQFGGMIALSNEIAAKKVSSEEETWSDQTLLIFRSNWDGIISQFRPFAAADGGVPSAASEAVEAAYTSAEALVLPHFTSGTAAATPYSRIGVRERRAMADASLRLRDALISASRALGLEG